MATLLMRMIKRVFSAPFAETDGASATLFIVVASSAGLRFPPPYASSPSTKLGASEVEELQVSTSLVARAGRNANGRSSADRVLVEQVFVALLLAADLLRLAVLERRRACPLPR
ncbi:MAG TPA: hypothetical protein VHQ21_05110 [Rhodanobacteraceae bacterium]|nr:hypothetical protein [Rhodanobacteraceae bacterium]